MASAIVLAPSISDPLCQEQLQEATKNLISSVEYCIYICKTKCGTGFSYSDLDQLASNASNALKSVTSFCSWENSVLVFGCLLSMFVFPLRYIFL